MEWKPRALWQASKASTGKSWFTRVALQCTTIRLIFLGFFMAFFGLLRIYHLQLCMQKVLRTAVRTVMTKLMTDFQFTFMMISD